MGLLEFSDKKIVDVIRVPYEITEEDIENIIVTATEGGCNYWMEIETSGTYWNNRAKRVPISQWATRLLLEKKEITLFDVEDVDEVWILTIKKLINGIEKEIINNHSSADKNNWDAEVIDRIMQYALFDAIVYS